MMDFQGSVSVSTTVERESAIMAWWTDDAHSGVEIVSKPGFSSASIVKNTAVTQSICESLRMRGSMD